MRRNETFTVPCGRYTLTFLMNAARLILEGYDENRNTVIEAPTGSGKTLAFLAALVAIHLAEDKESRKQKVVISRTHEQLRQILGALRRLLPKGYSAVQLASREKLCVNNKSLSGCNRLGEGCCFRANTSYKAATSLFEVVDSSHLRQPQEADVSLYFYEYLSCTLSFLSERDPFHLNHQLPSLLHRHKNLAFLGIPVAYPNDQSKNSTIPLNHVMNSSFDV
jgi:DEAD/DEAH box helicase